MNKLKVFEMFAGYGGASFALQKAGIPFKSVGYSEIDKYAIQCFDQNHSNIKNYGDATKINPGDLPDFDLLTGGFPCQPFSTNGKGKGVDDNRGLLFNEIIRIATVKRPQFMLLENVRGLTIGKHKSFYKYVIKSLRDMGYYVIYKLLDSKDYGVPQRRKRMWFICFKFKNDFNSFNIPLKREYMFRLDNVLDNNITDERYLLPQKTIDVLKNGFINDKRDHISTLTCGGNIKQLGKFKGLPMLLSAIYNTVGIFRILTGKEAFKLMGFNDININLDNIPEKEQYKLAGNGWEINIVSLLFIAMFGKYFNINDAASKQKSLFDF